MHSQTYSEPEQKHLWFIEMQNSLIKQKLELIKFWEGEVVFWKKTADKNPDDVSMWLECMKHVSDIKEHISALYKTIDFNRGMINVARGNRESRT